MTDAQQALFAVLDRIAVALERLAGPVAAPADAEPEPPTCAHPDTARVDFSGQGTDEWLCTACGYRHAARLVRE